MTKSVLQTKLELFATQVGKDIKGLNGKTGTLTTTTSSLQTQVTNAQTGISNNQTDITKLKSDVKALQDGKIDVNSLMSDIRSNLIKDTSASANTVYSSTKVNDLIIAAKNELLNGAGTAYDTLKELGDLINANKDTISSLQQLAANHVSFTTAQSLTDTQKNQARSNIAAASATEVSTLSGKVTNLETTVASKLPRTGTRGQLAGWEETLSTNVTSLNINQDSNDNIYASAATTVTVADGATGTAWTKTISFATAPTITLGGSWKWVGGSAPTTASGTILVVHWNNFVGYANLLTV